MSLGSSFALSRAGVAAGGANAFAPSETATIAHGDSSMGSIASSCRFTSYGLTFPFWPRVEFPAVVGGCIG